MINASTTPHHRVVAMVMLLAEHLVAYTKCYKEINYRTAFSKVFSRSLPSWNDEQVHGSNNFSGDTIGLRTFPLEVPKVANGLRQRSTRVREDTGIARVGMEDPQYKAIVMSRNQGPIR